jgi:hypothetical protein
MNLKRIRSSAILLVALQAAAFATPVTWYLSGVQFADGATASGSFVYDADTDTYSAVNITTTSGSSFAGVHYLLTLGAGSHPYDLAAVTAAPGSLLNTPMLQVWYTSSLTNSGGTVPLLVNSTGEFNCENAGCGSVSIHRLATAGSVTTTVSAAPSSAAGVPALSGVGLGFLGIALLACAVTLLRRPSTTSV